MATRFASPSLRRRFAWMFASIFVIALISGVSIAIYRQQKQPPPAGVVAADEGKIAEQKVVDPAQHSGTETGTDKPDQPLARSEQTTGTKAAGDFHSVRYGYTVALEGTRWTRWEDLSQIVPEAEWGALLGEYGRFLIVPVSLGQLDPRPEALDHVLLGLLGIAYPSDQLNDFQTIERQGLSGHSFQLTREVRGAENVYRIWVLRRSDTAFLAAAWIDRSGKNGSTADVAVLDDVLNRLSFDTTPPQAPLVESLNTFQRQAHGNIYKELGLSAFDAHDFSGSIDCFRRAFQLRPNDPAILTNLVNSHVELKEFQQALSELEPNINRFANQPELWAGRAFLLAQLGDTEAAASAYAALFASGYWAEAPFTQYVALLAENEREDEALAAVQRCLQSKDSFTVRRLQASLYRQRGNNDEAVAILTRLAKDRPFNPELHYDLADCYAAAGQYSESFQACRQLLDHRYDTAHTYFLQARSQYGLKWYVEAKESLELALKREPANKDAQELLQLVAGMLGEGSNAAVREEIEPVPLPKELSIQHESEARGTPDETVREFGAHYVRRDIAISFIPGKEFKLTDRRTICVTDASGVQRFSTIQVPLDPLGEQLFVNRLQVTDAQGRETALGKSTDYYIVDGARTDAPTHGKVLNIPVPGLEAGSTIKVVFTRRDISPPHEFPYTAHLFSAEVPVLSATLFVAAEGAEIKSLASSGVRQESIEGGQVFSIDRPMVYRREPLQPAPATFLPGVAIGSSKTTWEQLGKDYLASISDRMAPDSGVQALADEVTKGCRSDEDRLTALVRYVQDRLTYKAVEFGRHARVPSAAADIIAAKYGDCKDHALLLVQLLGACHIKGHLALANLDASVDPQIAALEQFNHMLVYVPAFRGGKCFDCTEKNLDLASLAAPVDLGSAKVFVLDAEEPHFIDLPSYEPNSSCLDVARTVRVANEKDASVEETVTVTGYHAAFLRGMFKGVAVADRAATLQQELAPLGGSMHVQSLQIEHLSDPDQPLIFKAEYLVRGRFQPADGRLVGQIPALWEQMYLNVPPARDRRGRFEVEYPLEFSSKVEFIAPTGFAIQASASSDRRDETPFCTWRVRTIAERQQLTTEYHLQLHAGTHPASDYARYDQDLSRATAALSQNVILKRAK